MTWTEVLQVQLGVEMLVLPKGHSPNSIEAVNCVKAVHYLEYHWVLRIVLQDSHMPDLEFTAYRDRVQSRTSSKLR